MIHYTKNEPAEHPPYYACHFDKVFIGSMDLDSDGFYYFKPSKAFSGGEVVAGWVLRDLAHKLEALNEAHTQKLLADNPNQ